MKFISSSETAEKADLLSVGYTRVQKESPEFLTIHEGIEQAVDVKISTFRFYAAPEPVVSLYDFIMTTFVPQSKPEIQQDREPSPENPGTLAQVPQSAANTGKIKVGVELASVQGSSHPSILLPLHMVTLPSQLL